MTVHLFILQYGNKEVFMMYKQITASVLIMALFTMLTACMPATTDNISENEADVTNIDVGTSGETTVSEVVTSEIELSVPQTANVSQLGQTSSAYPVRVPPAPTPIVDVDEPAQMPGEPAKKPEPFRKASVDECYIFTFYSPGRQSPEPNNAGIPDDYITVEYDAGVLLGSVELADPVRYVGTDPVTIEQFNYAFPIECLRQIDENTYYAVYRLRQGGYFYVHFQKMYAEPTWDKQLYNGCIAMTAYSYVAEKHTSADFVSIQTGDLFSKMEEVDGSACLWIYAQLIDRLDSCLILEDGVIRIYATKNEQGEYIIREKQFYEGGKIDYGSIPPLSMYYEAGLIINQNILPKDFPQ